MNADRSTKNSVLAFVVKYFLHFLVTAFPHKRAKNGNTREVWYLHTFDSKSWIPDWFDITWMRCYNKWIATMMTSISSHCSSSWRFVSLLSSCLGFQWTASERTKVQSHGFTLLNLEKSLTWRRIMWFSASAFWISIGWRVDEYFKMLATPSIRLWMRLFVRMERAKHQTGMKKPDAIFWIQCWEIHRSRLAIRPFEISLLICYWLGETRPHVCWLGHC